LLLAKNEDGRTVWHWAAHTGSVAALEILWSWAKEADLNTYELKKNLLLAQDKQWDIAWQVAIYGEHVDILEKLRGLVQTTATKPHWVTEWIITDPRQVWKTAWELETDAGNVDVDDIMVIQSNKPSSLTCNLVVAQDNGKLNDTWWQEDNCEVLRHL